METLKILLVFLTTLFVVKAKETDISVPLLDNIEAPLKAVIDISALNQQLQTIIKHEVQKGVKEAVKGVLNSINVTLVTFRQNLTSEMENSISTCKRRQRGPAFSAVFKGSPSFRLLNKDEVLKFDEVYLNRDGGYNPTSGYFTAPLSGTYLVASTIRPYGTNLHCYLWHNAKRMALVFGTGWNTGSLQMTVTLVKGDKLVIKHSSSTGEKIQLGDTSMFSAVYISE